MTKQTGGPAFPAAGMEGRGMTLRDYFAAKAMAILWDAYDKGYCGMADRDEPNIEMVAEGAYQMADAMLSAREK